MSNDYPDDLLEAENLQESEEDFSETPPSDIVAFNELRSCADLLRMYEKSQLIIQPDFQRDVVWKRPAQTRFIDSLVKQLPIPSMCLSLDYKTGERLMIDGLQRISSIINFMTDDDWRLSNLEDIDSRISGRTPGYIRKHYYDVYSRVENLTIPVTVLRCDYSKKSHMHYLFTIFHRLNTGGNKLSNQEIRNCIFHGRFNEMLKRVVNQSSFRSLFSLEDGESYRFSYEELVLRIVAFSEKYEEYRGRLAKFLNDFMDSKKNISEDELSYLESALNKSVDLVYNKIMDGRPLPKLSKATTESIFVGILINIDSLVDLDRASLQARMADLRSDDLFSVENLKEGLSAKEKVQARIGRAVEIFSE